jgi:dolichol kinase
MDISDNQREVRDGKPMALTGEEINRKLLHIVSGTLIPMGILYLPLFPWANRYFPPVMLGIITIIWAIVEFLRLQVPAVQQVFYKYCQSMLRSEEKKEMTGAAYIFMSAFICSVLFFNRPHISFMVLNMFIIRDAVAAIVGLNKKKIKVGSKSLEGSIGCFAVCMVLCIFIYPHIPLLLDPWNGTMPALIALSASLLCTILELFPVRLSKNFVINDNLIVPVITGLVMMWLYPVVSGL